MSGRLYDATILHVATLSIQPQRAAERRHAHNSAAVDSGLSSATLFSRALALCAHASSPAVPSQASVSTP